MMNMSHLSAWLNKVMTDGHNGGACFWVMPVKIESDRPGNNWINRVGEHKSEEISIDEDAVECFLQYFLRKHYNRDLSVKYKKLADPEYYNEEFEWNLEHNVYTYDGVKEMLYEIRESANILENDFHDSSLDELKGDFPHWPNDIAWASYCDYLKNNENGERAEWVQGKSWESCWTDTDIAAVVDFYRRFCTRMEKMMECSPEFCEISFMGP